MHVCYCCVRFHVLSTKLIDWMERMSLKWPIWPSSALWRFACFCLRCILTLYSFLCWVEQQKLCQLRVLLWYLAIIMDCLSSFVVMHESRSNIHRLRCWGNTCYFWKIRYIITWLLFVWFQSDFPKDSDMVESFQCSETQTSRWHFFINICWFNSLMCAARPQGCTSQWLLL